MLSEKAGTDTNVIYHPITPYKEGIQGVRGTPATCQCLESRSYIKV